jgi:hypothetical protein
MTSLIVALAGNAAFATGGAGSWQAKPSDVSFISRNNYSVWNNDSSFTRSVTTGLTWLAYGSQTKAVTVYGKNNGLTATCWLFGVNTATGVSSNSSASTSVNGVYTLSLSLNPGGSDLWIFDVWCDLPHTTPAASYIYGVSE